MTQIIKQFALTQGISNGTFPVSMPSCCKILSVGLDSNFSPCLYAIVNPNTEMEERYFEIFSEDQELPVDIGIDRVFIGHYGNKVFNLFIFERLN